MDKAETQTGESPRLGMPAKLALIVSLVVLVVLLLWATGAWNWLWSEVVGIATSVHEQYGIDIPVALALFGVGELVFCGSIGMMLKETGQQVSWKGIHGFKLRSLNLGSPRMRGWLWVNRLSWIVPWLVVIAMSIGRVPWWATGAALLEVAATFGLGVVLSLGLRLPWWNEGSTEVEEA